MTLKVTPNMTEARRRLTELSAVELLALMAWGEARGESVEGKLAVICVALNRARAGGWFGKGIEGEGGVVLKPFQFSCFNENDPNLPQLVLLLDTPVKEFAYLKGIADVALGGWAVDVTHGATHYVNMGVVVPSWSRKMTRTVIIGHHTFFKE